MYTKRQAAAPTLMVARLISASPDDDVGDTNTTNLTSLAEELQLGCREDQVHTADVERNNSDEADIFERTGDRFV